MSLAAAPPLGAPRLATIVVITPTATVVTNRARTSPLMARNPARGLSASRRAAMSVAGRWARRAMTREPTMVSQGPAMTSPTMISRKPGRNAWIWPPVVPGCPAAAK